MFKFRLKAQRPIVALAFVLFGCTPFTENLKPEQHFMNVATQFPQLVLPFKHISNLEQCPGFTLISDTIFYQHLEEGVISAFYIKNLSTGWSARRAFTTSLNYSYVQLTPLKTFVVFAKFTPTILQFDIQGNQISGFDIPQFYDVGLQDTVLIYVHRSVPLLPQNVVTEMPFRLYKMLLQEPKTRELAVEAKYNHSVFLALNIVHPEKSKIFGKLSEYGFSYVAETENIYNNLETKFSFIPWNEKYLFASPKQESIHILNSQGVEEKILFYEYAQHEAAFNLRSNHPNPADYITESSFYQNLWLDKSGKHILRLLHRGKNNEDQLGQNETPWEILILEIQEKGVTLKHILKFAPGHFDNGDVHFVDSRYLFVSNKGIKNKNYDPENHSYSIIDLAEYLK